MGIFDKLFEKKSKDSEVKDVGIEKRGVKKESKEITTKKSTMKRSTVKPNVEKLKEKMLPIESKETPFDIKQIRLRGKNLEELHDLIRYQKLYMVHYYCFMKEADAREVYDLLCSGDYWIPIKCAIALRKADVFYPHWVVLYNSEPEYMVELPKPKTVAWYWSEYLTKMGLPKQDEFDEAKTDEKLWHNEHVAQLLDYFVSPSLKNGIYECLVCHERFGSHKALMDHLRDPEHGVQFNAIMIDQFNVVKRAEATDALERIGKAVDPLIQALKDENVYIRRGAAGALGKIGDVKAVEPLIQALKDENEGVRRYAAEALGEIGFRDDMEKAYCLVAKKEWDELVRLGEPAIEPLIQALKDRDDNGRRPAVEPLVKIREISVGPLIQALKDNKDEGVRGGAAEALGEIGDARAVEALIQAFKQEDWPVRRPAAEALGKIRDVTAVEPLIQALKNEHWQVRRDAAETLGKIGDARAIDPLTKALKDESEYVRRVAKYTLEYIKAKKT